MWVFVVWCGVVWGGVVWCGVVGGRGGEVGDGVEGWVGWGREVHRLVRRILTPLLLPPPLPPLLPPPPCRVPWFISTAR